jgi:acyl dehydratase
MYASKSIEEIVLGEKISYSRTFTEEEVQKFAEATGDFNPIHFDPEYAANSFFGARVVHGSLTTSLASAALGTRLPGLGTIAYEIHCRFRQAVYLGDTVTVTAEVIEKNESRNLVTFDCVWTNQSGIVVASGQAVVMPPRK